MKAYKDMTREELLTEKAVLEKQFANIKAKRLKLDMSRGKPSKEQLELSHGMMDVLHSDCYFNDETGTDCRNYGILTGIPEAKRLMGAMSEVSPEDMIIYGNSSLNVMFDCISRSFTHGVCGETPWSKLDKVKWLCPSPGYDRHFRITEYFGCELITVPMHEDGPDMDMVEEYVNNDPEVKGIWCVPKYSNPLGVSYSDEVVRRFANLTPAAPDFRLYWDNAYSIHHLYDDEEDQDTVLEILGECRKAGHPDIVYKFISTSKVTFPGSGLAALATSRKNLSDIKQYMMVQTIGHDKLNQLRHVTLDREIGELEIGTWTKPKGGYFISFDSLDGCAKKIVAKAAEAGVRLTEAGATFPYGIDPRDRNIRIAPSFPTEKELRKATEVFIVSVKLVSVNKYLKEMTSEPAE